jgi:hypothetical protein
VAGGHHAGQRPFGALAALEQPLREVAAGAQLRNRQIDRTDASVEIPVPVAVSAVDPLFGAFAIAGAAHGVGLGAHQRLDERGHQLAQHVRARLGELVGQHRGRIDTLDRGHRVRTPSDLVVLKDHAVTVLVPDTTRPIFSQASSPYTTLLDATHVDQNHTSRETIAGWKTAIRRYRTEQGRRGNDPIAREARDMMVVCNGRIRAFHVRQPETLVASPAPARLWKLPWTLLRTQQSHYPPRQNSSGVLPPPGSAQRTPDSSMPVNSPGC